MAVERVPTVHLLGSRVDLLVLLFLSFGARSLDLPVTAIDSLSAPPLPFGSFLCVNISGEAICTEMLFWHFFAMVVALNVLPGVTLRTVDSVAIVVRIDTYAFDRVFLLFLDIGVREGAIGQRRG
jgi:hypothetical protein